MVGFGFGLGLTFSNGLDWILDSNISMDLDLDLDSFFPMDWIGFEIHIYLLGF